jgi:hypothetical protein
VDEGAGRAPGGPAQLDPAQQPQAYARRSSGDAGQLLLAGVRTPAAVRPSPLPDSAPALPAAPTAPSGGRAVRRRGPCRNATTRPPSRTSVHRFAGSAPRLPPIRRPPGSRLAQTPPQDPGIARGHSWRVPPTGKRPPAAEPPPAALVDRQHQRLRRLQVDGDVGRESSRDWFVEARICIPP